MYKKFYQLLFLFLFFFSNNFSKEKLVIGYNSKKNGLFSGFFGVLNNLYWCNTNNVTPVIYWGKSSPYYVDEGYNNSTNVWEYYFEPVSKARYELGDKIRSSFFPKDGFHMESLVSYQCKKYTDKLSRRKFNKIINKYIRIKPQIKKKIENFYNKNMRGKTTIGIHIRGTDRGTMIVPTSVYKMCQVANQIARNIPNCQFFVATDEIAILNKAKELLKCKVIYYDSYRSLNGQPIHLGEQPYNKAKLGEEVLIEVLLLSTCHKFIHPCSNVSCAALFFNPDLDNLLVLAD